MSNHGTTRRRGYQAAAAAVLAMSTTLAGAAVLPATAASASPAHSAASQASVQQGYSAPISGTTSDGRAVTGTFTPQRFHVRNGVLVVTGMIQGNIEGKSQSFHRMVTTEVQSITAGGASGARMAGAQAGSCDVLNLVLGPLHLDLLGLVVDLNQVVLNITAQSGAGNLLGNLLCAVAGLLDNTGGGGLGGLSGLLTQLSGLLNQILGALGNL